MELKILQTGICYWGAEGRVLNPRVDSPDKSLCSFTAKQQSTHSLKFHTPLLCSFNRKGAPSGNDELLIDTLEISASSACHFQNCCWSVMLAGTRWEKSLNGACSFFFTHFSFCQWQRVMTVKWKDDAAWGTLFPWGCNWNVRSCIPDSTQTHSDILCVHTHTHTDEQIENCAIFSLIHCFH